MSIVPALQLSFPSQKRFCFVCLKHFLLGREGPCFSKRAAIVKQLLAFVSRSFVISSSWTWLSYFPRQNIAASSIHEYSKAICMGTAQFCVQPPHCSFEIWAIPFPCSTWQDHSDLENYQLVSWSDLSAPFLWAHRMRDTNVKHLLRALMALGSSCRLALRGCFHYWTGLNLMIHCWYSAPELSIFLCSSNEFGPHVFHYCSCNCFEFSAVHWQSLLWIFPAAAIVIPCLSAVVSGYGECLSCFEQQPLAT